MASMTSNIGLRCFNYLVQLFRSDSCKEKFDISSNTFSTESFIRWILNEDSAPAVGLKKLMEEKNNNRGGREFRTQYPDEETVFQELGTEQVRQYFKAARAIAVYGMKDQRVLDACDLLLPTKKIPITFVTSGNFISSKCSSVSHSGSSKFRTTIPRAFEVLLTLHAYRYVNLKKEERIGMGSSSEQVPNDLGFNIPKTAKSGNRIGYAVQLMVSTWNRIALSIGLKDCKSLISPYILFDKDLGLFGVLKTRSDGFAPRIQSESLMNISGSCMSVGDCDSVAWNRTEEMDSGMRVVTDLFFQHLHGLLGHPTLYNHAENVQWNYLSKYSCVGGNLPLVSSEIPEPVRVTLGMAAPLERAAEVEVIDVDAEEDITPENERSTTKKTTKRSRSISAMVGVVPKRKKEVVVEEEDDDDEDFVQVSNREEDRIEVNASEPVNSNRKKGECELESKIMEHMSPYCRIYDVHFMDLIDTESENTGLDLRGQVNFILTDPPYNVRYESGKDNSSHDVLTTEDMKNSVELFSQMLVPGGHGIVFCSMLQFQEWYDMIKSYEEDDDDDDDSEPGSGSGSVEEEKRVGREIPKKKKYVFDAERIMMIYIRSEKNYGRNPASYGLNHCNIVEIAIHFWKRGSGSNEAVKATNYKPAGYIQSSHPVWTNVMNNIPPVPTSEKVMKKVTDRYVMLRPEQKNIDWMKELISQYTKKGDIVVDMFGGTFSTAKACFELPDARRFIGCEADEECVSIGMPHVLQRFCMRVVNNPNGISVSESGTKDIDTYYKMSDLSSAVWDELKPPAGLPLFQKFPSYILRAFGEYHDYGKFSDKYRRLTLDKWPTKYRDLFENFPVKMLRVAETLSKGLSIRDSTIKHAQAGKGLFTTRFIAKGEEILTYYGVVVYKDLTEIGDGAKTYGTGMFQFSTEQFSKSAIELKDKVKDKSGKEHTAFVIPAPFSNAVYMNDPRYLVGDEEQVVRNTSMARKANVEFVERKGVLSADRLSLHSIVCIKALRQISPNEELFVDYGDRFMWK